MISNFSKFEFFRKNHKNGSFNLYEGATPLVELEKKQRTEIKQEATQLMSEYEKTVADGVVTDLRLILNKRLLDIDNQDIVPGSIVEKIINSNYTQGLFKSYSQMIKGEKLIKDVSFIKVIAWTAFIIGITIATKKLQKGGLSKYTLPKKEGTLIIPDDNRFFKQVEFEASTKSNKFEYRPIEVKGDFNFGGFEIKRDEKFFVHIKSGQVYKVKKSVPDEIIDDKLGSTFIDSKGKLIKDGLNPTAPKKIETADLNTFKDGDFLNLIEKNKAEVLQVPVNLTVDSKALDTWLKIKPLISDPKIIATILVIPSSIIIYQNYNELTEYLSNLSEDLIYASGINAKTINDMKDFKDRKGEYWKNIYDQLNESVNMEDDLGLNSAELNEIKNSVGWKKYPNKTNGVYWHGWNKLTTNDNNATANPENIGYAILTLITHILFLNIQKKPVMAIRSLLDAAEKRS